MPRLTYYPIADSYLLVVVVALLLAGLLALGPGRARARPARRVLLIALRAGVIALVVLAMLRPTLIYTERQKQSATLAVMIDGTRSMDVPDGSGGKTRWQELRETLEKAEDALDVLAENFELKAYLFDGRAHAAEVDGGKISLPDTPEGKETAIGPSILEAEAYARQAGKRLLAVVLLSDGVQTAGDTAPQTAAAELRRLGYSLYTIALGQSRGLGQAKDVRIERLSVNPTVFEKNELAVEALLRINGYPSREIPVHVLFETPSGEMKVEKTQIVQASADGSAVPVQFSFWPQTAGEFKLTVEAEEQPGELVTTNNHRSTFVNVLKGGLKVLYLEGSWRVEQKFIRRALAASLNIDVDYLRIDALDHTTRPGDMAERFKPGKYDVYILGDLDAKAFVGEELGDLVKAVDQGAGLIMLGGFHSFGPGGYATTPLAEILPVVMSDKERQRFVDPIRTDVHVSRPVKMRPTPYGLTHFALMLGGNPDENEALWAKLPLLEGANKFSPGNLADGALVLADDGPGLPLLVEHTPSTGRVMALAVDSTWRWWMGGYESAHKRFWRQIVLRLGRKDESADGNAWIRPEKRRYAPGEHVKFTMGARSATGEPIAGATYEAVVHLPEGPPRALTPAPQDEQKLEMADVFRDTQQHGDYRVELTVRHPDLPSGTAKARARFLVFPQDLELDSPAADTDMLQTMAEMTEEGKLIAPEQLPGLIERLARETESLDILQETKQTFWDTWPFFLLLVGLLGLEWYLRKRWGLV